MEYVVEVVSLNCHLSLLDNKVVMRVESMTGDR